MVVPLIGGKPNGCLVAESAYGCNYEPTLSVSGDPAHQASHPSCDKTASQTLPHAFQTAGYSAFQEACAHHDQPDPPRMELESCRALGVSNDSKRGTASSGEAEHPTALPPQKPKARQNSKPKRKTGLTAHPIAPRDSEKADFESIRCRINDDSQCQIWSLVAMIGKSTGNQDYPLESCRGNSGVLSRDSRFSTGVLSLKLITDSNIHTNSLSDKTPNC